MNFESLKLGFKSYLEGISETSNKTYVTDSSDVSIFMYANEFKNYLVDELNCDVSIFSKDINQILDMDIINGQLVDAQDKLEDDEVESPDTAAVQSQEQPENPAIDNSTTELSAENTNTNIEDPNLITNILNDLLQDTTFKETLDRDGNGNIDEKELSDFFDIIKDYDLDGETISLEDLISAAQDIKDGVFRYATDEIIEEEIGPTPQADAAGIGTSATPSSGGGGSFNVPSTYNEAQSKANASQEQTLDNMTREELNSELKTAQTDLSDKQNNLSAILDGSDPAIAQLKENVDKTYEAYLNELKAVDEDMADKLDTLKTTIDDQESKIDAKEQEIADQETTVSDCENTLENATSRRENLESILYTLEQTDSADMDADKKAELQSRIQTVKSQIEEAKTAEQNAETALQEAKDKLTELENEKTDLESELETYKAQMTLLEKEITDTYPEIAEFMEAYKTAQETYTTEKAAAISNAKSEIQEAQNYVNEVQTAITNLQNKEDTKEYCLSGDLGEEVLEFAYSMRGFSEGQVEGVCGYNLPDGLWCAAFVKFCLTETYGDDLPDWYTNCNYNSCSEVLAAANNNGCAFTDASDAKPGDLIIFNTSRGTARHIGIVVSVENGIITTIEGNTSSRVDERTYEVGSSKVNSFVRVSG